MIITISHSAFTSGSACLAAQAGRFEAFGAGPVGLDVENAPGRSYAAANNSKAASRVTDSLVVVIFCLV